jgi:hypothetical protein
MIVIYELLLRGPFYDCKVAATARSQPSRTYNGTAQPMKLDHAERNARHQPRASWRIPSVMSSGFRGNHISSTRECYRQLPKWIANRALAASCLQTQRGGHPLTASTMPLMYVRLGQERARGQKIVTSHRRRCEQASQPVGPLRPIGQGGRQRRLDGRCPRVPEKNPSLMWPLTRCGAARSSEAFSSMPPSYVGTRAALPAASGINSTFARVHRARPGVGIERGTGSAGCAPRR